jgi:hypothetical protein
LIEGINGDNVIRARGDTLEAAYLSASNQTQAVGIAGKWESVWLDDGELTSAYAT